MSSLDKIFLESYYPKNKHSKVYPLLAEQYLNEKNADKAISVCQAGFKYDPNNVCGFYILALAEIKEKKLKNAFAHLKKCIELDPDFLQAYYKLVSLGKKILSPEEKQHFINQIARINPYDAHAVKNIKPAQKFKNVETAADDFSVYKEGMDEIEEKTKQPAIDTDEEDWSEGFEETAIDKVDDMDLETDAGEDFEEDIEDFSVDSEDFDLDEEEFQEEESHLGPIEEEKEEVLPEPAAEPVAKTAKKEPDVKKSQSVSKGEKRDPQSMSKPPQEKQKAPIADKPKPIPIKEEKKEQKPIPNELKDKFKSAEQPKAEPEKKKDDSGETPLKEPEDTKPQDVEIKPDSPSESSKESPVKEKSKAKAAKILSIEEASETLLNASPPKKDKVKESDKVELNIPIPTLTFVEVLKKQKLYEQALDILDVLEEKSQDLDKISKVRSEIMQLKAQSSLGGK